MLAGGETAGPNASFITPTLLTDVRADMAVVREEIFGPVVVAQRYSDLDEVVAAGKRQRLRPRRLRSGPKA